jgi:formylglycine-generating enzyme required for sulfatase activity
VEYTKIQDCDWEHGKWSSSWRYLVFVLHADGKVQLVDLGEAAQLEKSIQSALTPIGIVGSNVEQQQSATRSLYQQLWQPIATAVGDANKVVFSPDGLLNLVPFAAMQDQNGHYLIESKQISYVTSGRDLTKGDLGIQPETELFLAANPQFDLTGASLKVAANDEPVRGAVRSAGFEMYFSPLPGTAKEAEQIPGYLKGQKVVLTGNAATEESVLNAKRPRVMHLSTHGFFLADQSANSQGTRSITLIKGSGKVNEPHDNTPASSAGYENPLVRSGLAFAGANHAGEAQGGRDGLLTAMEVSSMDLHGTDLVTLSACETGRGEVKSGEGVFGLRRAFALAGTQHLLMSLWPVSDDVTATQMRTFYQMYGKHTNPAAALRQAQLATIADLRKRNGQAEPALWAPFIVQGGETAQVKLEVSKTEDVMSPLPALVFKHCAECPEMVVIPAGNFDMGSNKGESNEKPIHRVDLVPYAMGKTEVTQGQWKAIMGNNPSEFKNCGDSCPVENVSLDDAKKFIQKLNAKTGKQYRLPSEAEWEYACRSGDKANLRSRAGKMRYEYCGDSQLDNVAWYSDNSGHTTHPAAQKEANPFGLYDMNGNVHEWVEDSGEHNDYVGTPTDGSAWRGDDTGMLRGGSWLNKPLDVRASKRIAMNRTFQTSAIGFRLAQSLSN